MTKEHWSKFKKYKSYLLTGINHILSPDLLERTINSIVLQWAMSSDENRYKTEKAVHKFAALFITERSIRD